jgi:hypothetical protein
MSNLAKAYNASRRFFELAAVAAKTGGFWVSAGGGTANVIAGEISRQFDVEFAEAKEILSNVGEDFFGTFEWYAEMAWCQPWSPLDVPDDLGRWDARLIAKAACRRPVPDPRWRSARG